MAEKRPLPEVGINCWKSTFRPESNIGRVLDDRIKLIALIGSGACGAVYHGVDIRNQERYAVKVLPKFSNPRLYKASDDSLSPPSPTPKRRKKDPIDPWPITFDQLRSLHRDNPTCRAYREVALHLAVHDHPNIVTIHEVLDSQDLLWMALDYYPKGDLFHVVTDLRWYVSEEDYKIKRVFNQILDAVEYCHSQGIYHCDLKPENILATQSGEDICLVDFGLATRNRMSHELGCGSSFYMSPERVETSKRLLKTGFSTVAADIWALGVILLNLVCGRNPWRRANLQDASYVTFRREHDFLLKIMSISKELNVILRRIFFVKPSQCLSVDMIRQLVNECPRLRTEEMKAAVPAVAAASALSSFLSASASPHSTWVTRKNLLPMTPISSPQIGSSSSPLASSLASSVEIALSPGTKFITGFEDQPYLNTPPTLSEQF